MNYFFAHPAHVGLLAAQHVALVGIALLCALTLALPIGLFIARRSSVRGWVLGLLGAIYTIPSLALLAIIVQAAGLGPAPIFIALVAYGQFTLVRNIVTAILAVDPAQVDAATGLGMSALQRTISVEIPQALRVIVGGVRITAVTMISLATLGGYVGAGGLGSLIFLGLTLHHTDEIVAGSLAAAALAVAADALLRMAERAVRA